MQIIQSPVVTLPDSRVSAFEMPPPKQCSEGRYTVRFAKNDEEIDAALRLRFEVFNLELNEGLEASFINERDEDIFDKTCHHLIVIENETETIVGTYRVRTMEMAQSAFGFYSSGEFAVEDLPYQVLAESIETGRACIARKHRNSRVLFLLLIFLLSLTLEIFPTNIFGCFSAKIFLTKNVRLE